MIGSMILVYLGLAVGAVLAILGGHMQNEQKFWRATLAYAGAITLLVVCFGYGLSLNPH